MYCMWPIFDLLHLFQYSQYPVNDKKAYNSNSQEHTDVSK